MVLVELEINLQLQLKGKKYNLKKGEHELDDVELLKYLENYPGVNMDKVELKEFLEANDKPKTKRTAKPTEDTK